MLVNTDDPIKSKTLKACDMGQRTNTDHILCMKYLPSVAHQNSQWWAKELLVEKSKIFSSRDGPVKSAETRQR